MRPALLVLGVVLFAHEAAASDAKPSADPAQALADQVQAALGGAEAWNAVRFVRFDFAVDREGKTVVRRSHTWDKHAGRYRLEGRTREGDKPFVVVMNLHTKEGSAWLDGAPQAGDELKKQLENGYGAWVNDTYWLLMPYKLKDPGVSLKLDGEERGPAGTWDKLLLTFDNVGLTPKDRYWAYVNRETRLVDRWDYVLKGETTEPTRFDWKGWKAYGAVKLADERLNPANGTRIYFPVLELPVNVPDSAFAQP